MRCEISCVILSNSLLKSMLFLKQRGSNVNVALSLFLNVM